MKYFATTCLLIVSLLFLPLAGCASAGSNTRKYEERLTSVYAVVPPVETQHGVAPLALPAFATDAIIGIAVKGVEAIIKWEAKKHTDEYSDEYVARNFDPTKIGYVLFIREIKIDGKSCKLGLKEYNQDILLRKIIEDYYTRVDSDGNAKKPTATEVDEYLKSEESRPRFKRVLDALRLERDKHKGDGQWRVAFASAIRVNPALETGLFELQTAAYYYPVLKAKKLAVPFTNWPETKSAFSIRLKGPESGGTDVAFIFPLNWAPGLEAYEPWSFRSDPIVNPKFKYLRIITSVTESSDTATLLNKLAEKAGGLTKDGLEKILKK